MATDGWRITEIPDLFAKMHRSARAHAALPVLCMLCDVEHKVFFVHAAETAHATCGKKHVTHILLYALEPVIAAITAAVLVCRILLHGMQERSFQTRRARLVSGGSEAAAAV